MEVACSFLTLSRSRFLEGPRRNVAIRAAAAAAAGFDGHGLSDADLPWAGQPLACPVTEIEWGNLSDPDWPVIEQLFTVAAQLGTVRRFHVGSSSEKTGAERSNLSKIADLAFDAGLMVCVEPVVFGGFPRLYDVVNLAASAGAPHVKVLYDTWQVYRTERKLPYLDPALIGSIQVSGTPWRELHDPLTGAMNRELPTAGREALEMADWLARIRAAGYEGPVAAEVPHARFRNQRVACHVIAQVTHGSTTDLLEN